MFYLSGNGGFGGGLESLNILSMLCEVRKFFDCVCSKISRSCGVNGISGSDVRCVLNSGRCNVLLLVFDFVEMVPPFFSRSDIFSLAICTKFCSKKNFKRNEKKKTIIIVLFSIVHTRKCVCLCVHSLERLFRPIPQLRSHFLGSTMHSLHHPHLVTLRRIA